MEKKIPKMQVNLNIDHSQDCTFTLEISVSKFID